MPVGEDSPTPSQDQELDFTRSEKFFKVYANNAQVEVSLWDFRLIFGEATKAGGNKMCIEQSVAVVMSPQHMKALVGVLASNLKEYESKIGEIVVPPKDKPSAEANKKPA